MDTKKYVAVLIIGSLQVIHIFQNDSPDALWLCSIASGMQLLRELGEPDAMQDLHFNKSFLNGFENQIQFSKLPPSVCKMNEKHHWWWDVAMTRECQTVVNNLRTRK